MIFSLPKITIWVDKTMRRQKPVQCPINLPPAKTKFCGKKKVGRNISDIKIIPEKKITENIRFLNIDLNVILIQIPFVFY